MPLERLHKSDKPVVTKGYRKGEDQREGEEIKQLRCVKAGFMIAPVPNHNPSIQHHKDDKAQSNYTVRPG